MLLLRLDPTINSFLLSNDSFFDVRCEKPLTASTSLYWWPYSTLARHHHRICQAHRNHIPRCRKADYNDTSQNPISSYDTQYVETHEIHLPARVYSESSHTRLNRRGCSSPSIDNARLHHRPYRPRNLFKPGCNVVVAGCYAALGAVFDISPAVEHTPPREGGPVDR